MKELTNRKHGAKVQLNDIGELAHARRARARTRSLTDVANPVQSEMKKDRQHRFESCNFVLKLYISFINISINININIKYIK